MRRILLLGGLLAISLVFVSQAVAATTVPVSMTLAEPLQAGTPGNSVCPDIGLSVTSDKNRAGKTSQAPPGITAERGAGVSVEVWSCGFASPLGRATGFNMPPSPSYKADATGARMARIPANRHIPRLAKPGFPGPA
jgi:hypothetical protein